MAALPDRYVLISLGEIDSTNEEAKRRANAGAPDGTVVTARAQTAGRGRRRRTWISTAGNLHVSILLRPESSVRNVAQIGFVASLAIADAVARHLPPGVAVTCKWPNDVLVAGRKIAGILMEAQSRSGGGWDWVVVGIGINVVAHPEDTGLLYLATSLAAAGNPGVSCEALLSALMIRFEHWRHCWTTEGFPPVRTAWLARAQGVGGSVEVRLENETLTGTFKDLDGDGALILDQAGHERLISAGDVFPVVV